MDQTRRDSNRADTAVAGWAPSRWTPWIGLVAALLLIAWLEDLRRTPEPRAGMETLAASFSAVEAERTLRQVFGAGDGGEIEVRPTGSAAAGRVREGIVGRLVELGVAPDAIEIQSTVACRDSERWSYVGCALVENVIARLVGPSEGPAVVLMAHYDSVGAGPGVSDDAVGVATVLEVVRALQQQEERRPGERLHPIYVLITDAEEVGLFGARGFVDHHPLAKEGIGAVLNVEARGTGGQSLLFQASEDDAWLIDAYRAEAPMPATSSLYAEIYRRLPNDTDLSIFLDAGLDAGIAGVNFAYAEGVSRYHTPRDDLERLDRGSLQHHGDNLLAMAQALASHPDLGNPPAGGAVYTNLGPYYVVAYPESWALPLAIVSAVGILVLVGIAVLRREADYVSLTVSLFGLLGGAVAAVLVAIGASNLLRMVSGMENIGWAHPLPLRVALWSLVFWVSVLTLPAIRRLLESVRAGLGDRALSPWAWALGAWLWLAVLGLLAAVLAPGVSIFLTLPSLIAWPPLLVAALRPPASRLRDAAVVFGALALAYFWFQIARVAELGLGLQVTAAVAGPLAICALPFASLLATRGSRSRRALAALLGVAALAGFVGTIVSDTYSVSDPQGVSVLHFEDAGSEDAGREAKILVRSGADAPPEEVLSAADFAGEPTPSPEGLRLGDAYAAATEAVPLEPPSLDVLAVEETEAGRRLRFRLRGPGADLLRLYLPEEAAPRRVQVGEYDFDLDGREAVRGQHLLFCTGPGCDDVEFTVDLAIADTAEPIEAELYAIRYASVHGLPEAARRVAEARPPEAVPVHGGDRVAVRTSVKLPAASPSAPADGSEDEAVRPES